jgi:hypothetical protein
MLNVPSRDGPEIAATETRRQVLDDRWQCDGLECDDRHIAEQDRPGTDEGRGRAKRPVRINVLATGLRHCGGKFGVSETDQDDDNTTEEDRQHRADAARAFDPGTGQGDPAPADHCAERQRQDFPAPDDANELSFSHQGSGCASSTVSGL